MTLRIAHRYRLSFYNLLRRSYRGEEELAACLGRAPEDILVEAEMGRLLVVELPWCRYFPRWQVYDGELLPHLAELLGAFPDGTHPTTIDRWCRAAHAGLELEGAVVSPVKWLRAGGSIEAVLALRPGAEIIH
jgi:hypothetical protein